MVLIHSFIQTHYIQPFGYPKYFIFRTYNAEQIENTSWPPLSFFLNTCNFWRVQKYYSDPLFLKLPKILFHVANYLYITIEHLKGSKTKNIINKAIKMAQTSVPTIDLKEN